jgi:hypothetical protein
MPHLSKALEPSLTDPSAPGSCLSVHKMLVLRRVVADAEYLIQVIGQQSVNTPLETKQLACLHEILPIARALVAVSEPHAAWILDTAAQKQRQLELLQQMSPAVDQIASPELGQ